MPRENKYVKTYIKLMRKRQIFQLPNKGNEAHHVFPKSIFGNNKLTVVLSYREHFIAHRLLAKIYELRYGKYNKNTAKMYFALSWFSERFKFGSREYEVSRRANILANTGINNPNLGRKRPEGFGLKITNRQIGVKFTEERKSNISKATMGRGLGQKRPDHAAKMAKGWIIKFPDLHEERIKNLQSFCKNIFKDKYQSAAVNMKLDRGYKNYFAKKD